MEKDGSFMKERRIFPLLVSMALPMVLSMTINSLYNIVDSYFVAMLSDSAMTALSLVYPVQNAINSVAIGFGIGINAAISYFSGARDMKGADKAASLGLILSIFHGLVLTVISIGVMPSFLRSFTSDPVLIDYGMRYSVIVFLFSVINMAGLSYEKIFQAVGRMKISMVALAAGCLFNIVMDPVLIFTFSMGIEGAAIATGLGQTVSLLVYLIFYKVRPMEVRIHYSLFRFDKAMAKRLYAVGLPATLNLALSSLLVTALNAMLSSFSEIYVLILGLYYKLQSFLYLPSSGIVQGMRPIIGYNYGAREMARVRKTFNATLLLCIAIMSVGTLIAIIFPESLISLFSEDERVIEEGAEALRIISIGFVVSSISVTASGALEGLGKGKESLLISLCRFVIFIIPLAYLLCHFFGPEGVWHSFWITEILSAFVSLFVYRRVLSRL